MDKAEHLARQMALRERPHGQHVMYQTWRDLLFLHWEVDSAEIQSTLPAGLTVDTFDGKAYIGLVPFFMCNIRPRFLPAVRGISWFLETNVRTYVVDEHGRPGVWFYSLDCNQRFAVWVARTFFRLPYFNATMKAWESRDGWIAYETARRNSEQSSRFRYRGVGSGVSAEPNTLAFFLVERYLLFAQTKRGLACGRVHHLPYQINSAKLSASDSQLLSLAGFGTKNGGSLGDPDHILYSEGVSVKVYPLQLVNQT